LKTAQNAHGSTWLNLVRAKCANEICSCPRTVLLRSLEGHGIDKIMARKRGCMKSCLLEVVRGGEERKEREG